MQIVRIHHLNCATLRLQLAQLADRRQGYRQDFYWVVHCLLIETDAAGLVLVDAGFSTLEVSQPDRIPPLSRFLFRPALDRAETALAQCQALGFDEHDVRHIVFTHLHNDHANGLADFPWATAHVYGPELEAAGRRFSLEFVRGYHSHTLKQHARWQSYPGQGGDVWKGVQNVRPIEALGNELALVPLAGHTAGHCGVAVHDRTRWLLHSGDAYFHRDELQPAPAGEMTGLLQQWIQANDRARRASLDILRGLKCQHPASLDIFCSHDPVEFKASQGNPR